jgi:hypothetical protein
MLGQRNGCMREGQDRLRSTTTVIENADKSSVDFVRRRVGNWRWPRSVRHARSHSILTAVILWTFAIISLMG